MDNMERIIKKLTTEKTERQLNNHNTRMQLPPKNLPASWETAVSLPASCTTPKLQQPKTDPIEKNYIGLTEGSFKQRYTQQALSFRNRHYHNSTEVSKFIPHLKHNKTDFKIKWSILTSAAAYSNKSRRCNLCFRPAILPKLQYARQ